MHPDKHELRTSATLFILTFFSLTFKHNLFTFFLLDWSLLREIFFYELGYSVPLLLILFAHEMGHYIPARFYGLSASLPYFIPFPFGPIGTMGAVIRIREPIPNKIQLFDIGIGGPLMSFVLSVPCWIGGLYLSELVPLESISDREMTIFFGDSLFTFWTAQWILGPYDPAELDVLIHPLARAGWVGLIVTAINLLPFGQLDGGHIIYAVFGEKYRTWIHYLFLGFLTLSFWNFTWLIWGFLIYFLIRVEHPYVPDHPFRSLDSSRKKLGIFMLLCLVLIFVPTPIRLGFETEEKYFLESIIESINGSI